MDKKKTISIELPAPPPGGEKIKKPAGNKKIIIVAIILSLLFGTGAGFIAALGGFYAADKYISPTGIFGEIVEKTSTKVVDEDSEVIDAVAKVQPAVVSIVVTKDLESIYQNNFPFGQNEFFYDFFGQNYDQSSDNGSADNQNGSGEKQEIGGGSGFVISADGLILTNRHVVSDDEADYTVITNEGTEYEAKVMAKDTLLDIAVIKIDAQDLPVAELGDSEALEIGQTVIAIGNTLGEYTNSVTKGIVSGKGRAIVAQDSLGAAAERLENVIQTDAAINPGNSGGPLINIAGQVVGISAAVDLSGQLIGFAIPINDAKEAIDSVKTQGKIVRPELGVRYVIITKGLAERNNLPVDYGALVVGGENADEPAIVPGSAASLAGLAEKDIILEVGGKQITEEDPLAELIQKQKIGEPVKLKILRDGKEKELTVTLKAQQDN